MFPIEKAYLYKRMRLLSKFFLFSAAILIVGHNLVPHHHEFEVEAIEHHHHDHSHGDEAMDLNDIFAHFIHGNIGYVTLAKSQIDSKSFHQFFAVIPENIYLSEILIPPQEYISPHDLLLSDFLYLLPSGLRGPPLC